MRALYYFFKYFFITHPQMWEKIWGGGLAPQAPDERRLCWGPKI